MVMRLLLMALRLLLLLLALRLLLLLMALRLMALRLLLLVPPVVLPLAPAIGPNAWCRSAADARAADPWVGNLNERSSRNGLWKPHSPSGRGLPLPLPPPLDMDRGVRG